MKKYRLTEGELIKRVVIKDIINENDMTKEIKVKKMNLKLKSLDVFQRT